VADTVQDPLRMLMSMTEDLRSNIDSMINQGTKSIQASLPTLPGFPGGKTPAGSKGIGDILSKLPKIPSLPPLPGTEAAAEKRTTTAERPTPPSITLPSEGYRLRNTWHPTGYQLRA
jgi:hypothetical protein